MNTNRSDYVLVWALKRNSSINDVTYCSVCRVQYEGTHCPIRSQCAKDIASLHAFNNIDHIIIATKDFCKGKQYGCNIECDTCTIVCTYNTVKVLL